MVRDISGKHPQYFEAILQLREISQEVLDFVQEEITKYHIPVAKVEELKNGFDFYLADNKFAKALGKKLQDNFGGEKISTSSIYGQKDGKEIYRGTILFREAQFKKGDIVEYKDDQQVVLVLAKEIILQNLRTGKKVHLKYREMGKIKKR